MKSQGLVKINYTYKVIGRGEEYILVLYCTVRYLGLMILSFKIARKAVFK